METGYKALGVVLMIIYAMSLGIPFYYNMQRKRIPFSEVLRPRLRFGFFYLGIFIILTLFITIFFISKQSPKDPNEVLEYAVKENLYGHQVYAYYMKTQENPYDYESIYLLHSANKKVDESKKKGFEEDNMMEEINWYSDYEDDENLVSPNFQKRDLALFKMAVKKFVYYSNYEDALMYLKKIRNKRHPFVQTLMAYCNSDDEIREQCYKAEIYCNSSCKTALNNLASFYADTKNKIGLDALCHSSRLRKQLDNNYLMKYAFQNNKLAMFVKYAVLKTFKGTNVLTIIGAVLIFAIWFYFIYALDTYKPTNAWVLFCVFAISFISIVITDYLYVFVNSVFSHHWNISAGKDFLYSVLVIGGIEETMKILPFLFVLFFTKKIKEPIDYIVYAAVSALGFSIVEDIMYFNSSSISTIYSRGIFTSLSHIVDTSIIAYALMLGKFYYKKNGILFFIIGFAVAIFSHGIYDFFILNETFKIWIIPYFILLFQAWLFVHMVNNCLNQAEYYGHHLNLKTKSLAFVVSGGLLFLIFIVYISAVVKINSQIAIGELVFASMYYFYPIYFFNVCINRIDVFFGLWDKFSFKQFVNPKIFFGGLNPRYSDLVNSTVAFYPHGRYTTRLLELMPIRAVVLERKFIDKYKGWFKIELINPIVVKHLTIKTVYFRTKENELPIHNEQRNLVSLYIENVNSKNIPELDAPLSDYVFLDWAEVKVIYSQPKQEQVLI